MTREEARRVRGDEPGTEDGGPDPAEDPIVYLREPEDEG
jgi:hypothetical protein